MPLSDASGCIGRLPAGRSGRQREADVFHPGVPAQRQPSKLYFLPSRSKGWIYNLINIKYIIINTDDPVFADGSLVSGDGTIGSQQDDATEFGHLFRSGADVALGRLERYIQFGLPEADRSVEILVADMADEVRYLYS